MRVSALRMKSVEIETNTKTMQIENQTYGITTIRYINKFKSSTRKNHTQFLHLFLSLSNSHANSTRIKKFLCMNRQFHFKPVQMFAILSGTLSHSVLYLIDVQTFFEISSEPLRKSRGLSLSEALYVSPQFWDFRFFFLHRIQLCVQRFIDCENLDGLKNGFRALFI